MRKKLVKRWIGLCIAIGVLAVLAGCAATTDTEQNSEPKVKYYYNFFDTESQILSYEGDSESTFEKRAAAASELLETYHKRMDIYNEYSGMNNLCTVNQNAGGEAVEVDRELMDFLVYAKELSERTGGKMNIMLGAVLRPWHDCREAALNGTGPAAIPDMAVLEKGTEHTSLDALELDEEALTVRIADPDARLDVGALGKGYATEMAARLLEDMGAKSYMLNIGGNIRLVGEKPGGDSWRIGIKDPFEIENIYAVLELTDTSCVTSGIYERYYTVDGVRYHHIIDPETLMPAAYFASVTVVTKDSGLADGLATALSCMSKEEGLALVNSLEDDVQVIWISLDGKHAYTNGLDPVFRDSVE